MHKSKWLYTVAGSGVFMGLCSYFNNGNRTVLTSWNPEFTPTMKWDYNWDKKEPPNLVNPTKKRKSTNIDDNHIENEIQRVIPTATRNLIFVRHGHYDYGKYTVDSKKILTALGREQAEITGERLKNLHFNFDRIIQSSMTRAVETSSIIQKYLPGVPVQNCDMLQEGVPSPTEPPEWKWQPMSKFHQDGARIEAAFRKYFCRADASQKQDSFELFVCHANVIRFFICRGLQFPPEAWMRFSLHHCSITWFRIRPDGRIAIVSVGDSGHLPHDKLTVNVPLD